MEALRPMRDKGCGKGSGAPHKVRASDFAVAAWNGLAENAKGQGVWRHVARDTDQENRPVIIKKYANRRLYNTDTSTYVTLEDLAEMVRSERDFVVYDAKTGEDLTHSVLTQIIVEQESRGTNLLPIGFLRQLIRFYGDSMQRLVPSYLEFSLDSLTRQQEQYRRRFAHTFGTAAFEAMQEQVRKNFATFERALGLFSPFTGTGPNESKNDHTPAAGTKEQAVAETPRSDDEIANLKAELSAMQDRLDQLSRR
jgi:polyhydroxyalkanoate synthesis repressor PhaR